MAIRRPYTEGGYEDEFMGGPYDQAPLAPEAAPQQQPFNEQAMRDAWNAQTDHSPDALGQLASGYAGVTHRGDSIVLPDGRVIDAVMDEGGLNNPGWLQVGAPGGISTGSKGSDPGLDYHIARRAQMNAAGKSGGSSGGGGGSQSMFGDMSALTDALKGLFPGGMYNQDIVNRRTEGASEALNRQRKSRLATNRAALADRGLMGDGPEATMMGSLEDDLYGQFSNAVSGIHADESENADSRMMQAMQIAASLTAEEASNLIEWFQAQTQRSLGEGQLALGNRQASNDFALGQGSLDLGRDRLDFDSESEYWDWLLRQNGQALEGADVTTRGYR